MTLSRYGKKYLRILCFCLKSVNVLRNVSSLQIWYCYKTHSNWRLHKCHLKQLAICSCKSAIWRHSSDDRLLAVPQLDGFRFFFQCAFTASRSTKGFKCCVIIVALCKMSQTLGISSFPPYFLSIVLASVFCCIKWPYHCKVTLIRLDIVMPQSWFFPRILCIKLVIMSLSKKRLLRNCFDSSPYDQWVISALWGNAVFSCCTISNWL